GEEDAAAAGQRVVVAVLVAGVGTGHGLVGLRRSHPEGRAPGHAVVVRGLIEDVGLQAVRVVDRVVIDDRDLAGRLVDGQRLGELVVLRCLVVEHYRRRPARAAVGRTGEPDAGLAARGGVGAGLVRRGVAAARPGHVRPRDVDV